MLPFLRNTGHASLKRLKWTMKDTFSTHEGSHKPTSLELPLQNVEDWRGGTPSVVEWVWLVPYLLVQLITQEGASRRVGNDIYKADLATTEHQMSLGTPGPCDKCTKEDCYQELSSYPCMSTKMLEVFMSFTQAISICIKWQQPSYTLFLYDRSNFK